MVMVVASFEEENNKKNFKKNPMIRRNQAS
jgi:hypothetical protein